MRRVPEKNMNDDQHLVFETLGMKLAKRFGEWARARQEIEEKWIEDLRAFNSQYDPDVQMKMAKKRGSKVFVSLTRTKTMQAYSRIIDMLFSSSMPPYGGKPTPVPDVPPTIDEARNMFEQAKQVVMQGMEAGEVSDPNAAIHDVMNKMTAEKRDADRVMARETCSRMMTVIEDQLIENGFENKAKRSLLEMCILGTGALKGATMRIEHKKGWATNESGGWDISFAETPKPNVEHVSIFDLYPEPYSTDLEDVSGLFHRHVMSKHQFRELKIQGFNQAEINYILTSYPEGYHQETVHEQSRRAIAGVSAVAGSNRRYEVLEYWGPVDGQELSNCGCHVPDPTVEYQANIWLCAGRVLMARLNSTPGQRIPYNLFPFERSPHQFWGMGPPRMMRHSQITINASARSMMDNLAITSGQQYEVNTSMLSEGEDPTDIYPNKVWLRDGGDPSSPMVRTFQPHNNANVSMGVMEFYKMLANEETSLPQYMQGEGVGATRTSSGLSMLMGAANIAIKSVIKNVDDYGIEPFITSMYDWNMRWNDRLDIKGDMRVLAQGSTSLIAKEEQAQKMINIMSMTQSEVYAPLVDHRAILTEVAKAMELPADKLIKPIEEGMSEQEQRAMQMREQQQQLEFAEKEAKIDRLVAEAEKFRADAQSIPQLRYAESQKDMAVAQRAVADISIQQRQAVEAPPLPSEFGDVSSSLEALPREIAAQAQFA